MNAATDKSLPAGGRPAAAAQNPAARAMALHHKALLLQEEHKFEEAAAVELKAITLAPNLAEAHLELGLFLLRLGEFGPGFIEYEWRWRVRHNFKSLPRFNVPRWNGMRIPQGRIVLFGDQGAGDKIQFCRYIPTVAERFREVYLTSPRSTAGLFRRIKGLTGIVDRQADLPPVDVFCPLSSLPQVLNTTLDTIPGDTPYMAAEPEKAAAWKARLDAKAQPGTLRVGISWAGSATHVKDRWRSTRFEQWRDILDVPGVSFFSLQKQVPDADKAAAAADSRLIDLTADIDDFTDTAALVSNLDLVIAVDTSVVHMAGALGIPAWVFLQWVPDWRWLLGREDSPWYPTLRLFRQETKDDYTASLRRAADELRALATGDRERLRPRA